MFTSAGDMCNECPCHVTTKTCCSQCPHSQCPRAATVLGGVLRNNGNGSAVIQRSAANIKLLDVAVSGAKNRSKSCGELSCIVEGNALAYNTQINVI